MQVEVRDDGGIVFIAPMGDIDGRTAPEFHDKVLSLILPQSRIVLNMQGVAFMSSAGLRSMLLIYREAKSKNARMVLTGINSDVRGSMSATGFLAFFVVVETVQDAILRMD